jgi:hypothetical protein
MFNALQVPDFTSNKPRVSTWTNARHLSDLIERPSTSARPAAAPLTSQVNQPSDLMPRANDLSGCCVPLSAAPRNQVFSGGFGTSRVFQATDSKE